MIFRVSGKLFKANCSFLRIVRGKNSWKLSRSSNIIELLFFRATLKRKAVKGRQV